MSAHRSDRCRYDSALIKLIREHQVGKQMGFVCSKISCGSATIAHELHETGKRAVHNIRPRDGDGVLHATGRRQSIEHQSKRVSITPSIEPILEESVDLEASNYDIIIINGQYQKKVN